MNDEHIPAPLPTQHHPTTDLLSMIPLPQSPPPPFIAAIANNPHAIATTEVSSTSFEPFVPTLKYNDGRWSEEETRLFEEGLRLYPRNNKKISALVGTRSVTQVMAKKEYRGKKARKAQETAAAAATNTIVQPTLQPAFQPFQIRQGEECPGCIPGSGKIKGHRGMHKRQGGRYNMPSQTSYTPPHPPIYVPPPQSMAYAPPQTPMFAAYNSFNQSQSYYVPPPNPPQISRLTANEDEFGRRLAETMNYEMTDEVDDDDDWVQVDVDEDVDVYHERDRAYLRHCLRNASFWNVPPKDPFEIPALPRWRILASAKSTGISFAYVLDLPAQLSYLLSVDSFAIPSVTTTALTAALEMEHIIDDARSVKATEATIVQFKDLANSSATTGWEDDEKECFNFESYVSREMRLGKI